MKKNIVTFILVLIVFFTAPNKALAGYWSENYAANAINRAIEVALEQIKEALIGALQREAAQMISDTINNMVAGTAQAGALFITDWNDYLFQGPRGKTQAYMKDFFSVVNRGKTSGNFASTCGNNFAEWRSAGAIESASLNFDYTSLQSTFEEYACSPAEMFGEDNWAAFSAYMQPNNNPIAIALISQGVAAKKESEEQKKAENMAQSNLGFISQTTKDGYVITPGSLIHALTADANTVDTKLLANADSVGRMAGIIVGKIASGVIKQGVGNARKNIQSKINNTICNGASDFTSALNGLSAPNGSLTGNLGVGSLGDTTDSTCRLQ